MTKKQSLATALQTFDRTPNSATEVSDPALVRRPRLEAQAPSRRGKKALIGYFDPGVSKQLKLLALEEDSTVQQLLGEALDLLFQARGQAPDHASPQILNVGICCRSCLDERKVPGSDPR